MVSFDPELIQKLATKIYRQARSVELTHSILGGVLGGIAGKTYVELQDGSSIVVPLSFLLGLLIGLSIARPKAFSLRVQAQMLLCNLQIEENTRQTAAVLSGQRPAQARG